MPRLRRFPSVFICVQVVAEKMPTDLIHLIGIRAPAVTIYEAITTEEGIRAWGDF
jgi:hypothetical protein